MLHRRGVSWQVKCKFGLSFYARSFKNKLKYFYVNNVYFNLLLINARPLCRAVLMILECNWGHGPSLLRVFAGNKLNAVFILAAT